MIPKDAKKPNNRTHLSTPALFALVVGGFCAYVIAFFSQPSIMGFVYPDGTPYYRFADFMQILFLEQLFDGMTAYGRMPMGILDRLPILLGAGCWMAAAWWIALPWVTFALHGTPASRLELHSLGLLSGLSLLSTVTLLIGLAGAIGSRWPLILAVAFLASLSWLFSRWIKANQPGATDERIPLQEPNIRQMKGMRSPIAEPHVQPENVLSAWLSRLIPVAAVGLALIYGLGSLMTPWEFDVVEYHLQAPKEFYQAGEIAFNDHNVYANMPLATEMHALAAMVLVGGQDGWWWGGLIGKAISGFHSLVAAALLGGFVARRYGAWSGWVAAGLLLAAPGNAHVAMAGLIDMVLGTYVLAGLLVLTLIWGSIQRGAACTAGLLLVSQFAGAAAACKYTGLLFAVIPLLTGIGIALVRAPRQPRTVRFTWTSLVGLSLTCLPWYAKNWMQAGNPFYPLAYGLFGGRDLTAARAAQWQNAHRIPTSGEGWSYSAGNLLESLHQLLLKSSFLHPSLVFLLICGIAVACFHRRAFRTNWMWGWLAVAVWVVSVWWLATHRIDRFWLPVLPIWSGIAAIGATWIGVRLSPALASVIVLFGLIYGAFIATSGAMGDNRFFVSLAALRHDVGDEEIPGRLSPAIDWANKLLKVQGNKLLLIGEAKAFDFQVPIVYATCFNANPGENWLRGKTPEEQRSRLKEEGITHILINWTEIARYRSPGNYGFSDWPQQDDFQRMIEADVLRPLQVPWDPTRVDILEVLQ